jgi:NAD(P)-dependent dehydrogenase (short-subunit alcohol dehydrogenase family)
MKDFVAKTVVVTGAGSGIGRALAIKFAKRGAFLALADINENKLKETEAILSRTCGKMFCKALDVSDRAAVYQFADQVQQELGRVDIVINNAGVTVSQTAEALEYDDFEWVMNINFWGVVYGTKAFLPYLKQSEESFIVNISSVFGLIAFPTQSAYNASKFAVRGFTEALRSELADTSVTPVCVHPGGIDTDIVRNARFFKSDDGSQDHGKAIDDFNKMARTTPETAADTIIRGIEKNDRRVLIGNDARIMDWIQRVFPQNYERILGSLLKRLRP